MNNNDQEVGKKEVERMELMPFLDAYSRTTGESLRYCTASENPDFLCNSKSGKIVGIELTRVMRDPRDKFWDRILLQQEKPEPYEAQERIYDLIERKEQARVSRYKKNVDETVLVLQLMDGTFESLAWILEGSFDDYTQYGFSEIWLADYSGLEAYGDIELFGLYPAKWWGLHLRSYSDRKPYG